MDKLVGREFKVDVTENDIINGKCMTASKCAIALAVNREIGEKELSVGYTTAEVDKKKTIFCNQIQDKLVLFNFSNSDDLAKWINDFDSNSNTVPIEITLKVISSRFLHDNCMKYYGEAFIK